MNKYTYHFLKYALHYMYTMITQYSSVPFEVFTVDNLYSPKEINDFLEFVETAAVGNRQFTSSPFKNGKVVNKELSNTIFERLKPYLPDVYVDQHGKRWSFYGSPNIVMYAKLCTGQLFGIHTDTGCDYDEQTCRYSKFTVLTYLNDSFSGGQTTFYDNNFKITGVVSPRTNSTLVFDIDLFHKGEQVTNGTKYWIGTELVCTLL